MATATKEQTVGSYSEQSLSDAQALEAKAKAEGKKLCVEVTDGSGFARNGLRFDTVDECRTYASDLFSRWMGAKEWRVAIAE